MCVTGAPCSGIALPTSIFGAGGVIVETAAFAELNEQVLAALGGSWRLPPSLDRRRREALLSHLDAARQVAAAACADGASVWADAQMLLLADLWQDVDMNLRFVVVIRNPLETVLSLRARHGIAAERGFSLCLAYLRCAAELVPPERRLVVHYDACLLDPATQAARLLAHASTAITRDAFREATGVVASDRRRFRASVLDLAAACPPRELLDLYGSLCLEAGYNPDAEMLAATFKGRPPNDRMSRTATPQSQILRIAKLVEEREQFRVSAETSQDRRADAEARLEHLNERVDEAQRMTVEHSEFVESLRSVFVQVQSEFVAELDHQELINYARATVDERERLRAANTALLEELYAVNRHRDELVTDLNAIWKSESWRLGRALTWPLRFLLRRHPRGPSGLTADSPGD
jgi:hypothetical protein